MGLLYSFVGNSKAQSLPGLWTSVVVDGVGRGTLRMNLQSSASPMDFRATGPLCLKLDGFPLSSLTTTLTVLQAYCSCNPQMAMNAFLIFYLRCIELYQNRIGFRRGKSRAPRRAYSCIRAQFAARRVLGHRQLRPTTLYNIISPSDTTHFPLYTSLIRRR